MARSLEQILRDLESLSVATTRIDQDLKELYKQYLAAFGQAVKRQLILAAYHLCTQVYPEAFLALSVGQRETLQRDLRQVANQGKLQIEQLVQAITLSQEASLTVLESGAEHSEGSLSQANVAVDQGEETQPPVPPSDTAEMAQRLSQALSLLSAVATAPLSPVTLAKRHVLLERQLRAILQTVSNLANFLLKQAPVLPDLPEVVIAAAAESEVGETGSSTPNLLNVLVEMGNRVQDGTPEEEPEDSLEEETFSEENDTPEGQMTHLVAINLRLADIEFADTQTTLWRNKIQETLGRLRHLGSQYQKLQREKARAEAEHAWRATWFDEER